MRLLTAQGHKRMPWKNGGGETREIAVHPSQATLDELQWRISMASVTTDGPFSLFPGIDRTLCILQGAGMRLDIGEPAASHELHIDSPPLSFAADQPAQAYLLDGGIVDLNVMTRRDTHRHSVQRLALAAHSPSLDVTETTIVFCERGNATCVAGAAAPVTLSAQDALVLDATEHHTCTITSAAADSRVLIIRIHTLQH